MKTPIISVVVPIYKTPQEFLRPCIESILAQTVTDSQIILVDDGSPDECGSICDEYAAKDPRILVIHQENAGPSAARNNGVLHATGHYLTFTDADDLLELNAWELAITALESSRAQCAVFGRMTGGEEHWEPMPVSEQTKNLAVEEAMAAIAGDNEACGGGYPWNKVWDADAVRAAHGGEIPLFDESLFAYEDKHWILVTLTGLERIVLLPELLYRYRFVASSLTNSHDSWHRRQFNAYAAYDCICDHLQPLSRDAYRAGLSMYFKFSFIDTRNMFSWRKADLAWWRDTKHHLHAVCRRIRPDDLKGLRYNLAWIVCLLTCWL